MRLQLLSLLIGIPLLPIGISQAQENTIPIWAREGGQQRTGSMYRVVCNGSGPDVSTARKEATADCLASARQQLTTYIKVKTITVQTEKESAFHEEVSGELSYTGLKCIPKKEELQSSPGQFKAWILCEFDLSLAKATPLESTESPTQRTATGGLIKNQNELERIHEKYGAMKTGRYVSGSQKTISIAVVPKCDELLVRGDEPARLIHCDENPISVVVDPSDTEIIVRAKGYLPKTIYLERTKGVEGYVQVILEPKQ